MAIDSKLLTFLKKHKFNKNEIITYAELNNARDKRTATDVTNQITKAFKTKNMKDIAAIVEAVFDDGKGGTVSIMNKNDLVYTDKTESFMIDYKIVKDSILFTKGNKKLTVEIELSTKAEQANNWANGKMQADIIKELPKMKSLQEFKDFAKDYEYTKA